MKASELIRMVREQHERIEQLERKVRELESRPRQVVYHLTQGAWVYKSTHPTSTATLTAGNGYMIS